MTDDCEVPVGSYVPFGSLDENDSDDELIMLPCDIYNEEAKSSERQLLEDAVDAGDSAKVRTLIQEGYDIKEIFPDIGGLLGRAVENEDIKMVELALEHNFHLQLSPRKNIYILESALRNNSSPEWEVSLLLLRTYIKNGMTPKQLSGTFEYLLKSSKSHPLTSDLLQEFKNGGFIFEGWQSADTKHPINLLLTPFPPRHLKNDVQLLQSFGQSINSLDKNGRTVIFDLGNRKLKAAVQIGKFDLTTRDCNGVTSYMLPVRYAGDRLGGILQVFQEKKYVFNLHVQALVSEGLTANEAKKYVIEFINNARDSHGRSSAHYAAYQGEPKQNPSTPEYPYFPLPQGTLAWLHELEHDGAKIDLHGRDQAGRTAMAYAQNDVTVLQLLSMGFALDDTDNEGRTIYMQSHQSLGMPDYKQGFFHFERLDSAERLRSILEGHIAHNVKAGDNHHTARQNALNFALHTEDFQGRTALHHAAVDNTGFQWLISQGADIHHADHAGYTVLMAACEAQNIDAVKYLLNNHARVDALSVTTDFINSMFAEVGVSLDSSELNLISDAARTGNQATISGALSSIAAFSAAGLDLKAWSARLATTGESALSIAVSKGNLELVQLLANHSAPLDNRNHMGNNLLHTAARTTNTELIRFLASVLPVSFMNDLGGADLSPLHYAVMGKDPSVAAALLQHNADPNIQNTQGERPLHAALNYPNMGTGALIDLLIQYGADVKATTNSGISAYTFAKNQNLDEVILAKLAP